MFDLSKLTGAQQTTDVYLAGLTFRKNSRVATAERRLIWQAVRGASAELIERIPVTV